MRPRVAVGIVGLGFRGFELARCVDNLSHAELGWLCGRWNKVRERASAQHRNARVTADPEDLLSDVSLDAVVLATSPGTQYSLARRALEANKHVLLDGVLGVSAHDAECLETLARERNLRFMIGHALFFDPTVRKLKELLELGHLGELHYLHAARHNPTAARDGLWMLAAKEVSTLLLLPLGEERVQVSVRGVSYGAPRVPDVLFCDFQFEGGVSAHLHLSRIDAFEISSVTVVGSKATAVLDDRKLRNKLTIYDRQGDVFSPHVPNNDPLWLQCDYFVCSIRSSAESVGVGKGAMVIKVIEALRSSFEAGGIPLLVGGEQVDAPVVPLHSQLRELN